MTKQASVAIICVLIAVTSRVQGTQKYNRSKLALGHGAVFKGKSGASYRSAEYNSRGPDGPTRTFDDGTFVGLLQIIIDNQARIPEDAKSHAVALDVNLSGNVFSSGVNITKKMDGTARLGEILFLRNGPTVAIIDRPKEGKIVNIIKEGAEWLPRLSSTHQEFRRTAESGDDWVESNLDFFSDGPSQYGPHLLALHRDGNQLTMKVKAVKTPFSRAPKFEILGTSQVVRHSLGHGQYVMMYPNVTRGLELRANLNVPVGSYDVVSVEMSPYLPWAHEPNPKLFPGAIQNYQVHFDDE